MVEIAERLLAVVDEPEPWPHGIIDDFLPADVFTALVQSLPAIEGRAVVKTQAIAPAAREVFTSGVVCDAIRQRFGFSGKYPNVDAVYRTGGVQAHPDRDDKPWSGVLYIAGDPKGTELYDASGKLCKVVEFVPNRLLCWKSRPVKEQHAIPKSAGRWVIQWWFLDKPMIQVN